MNSLRLLCKKCGHNKRLHGNGSCRSIGCKGCKGFKLNTDSVYTSIFQVRESNPHGKRDIGPYEVALFLAENDVELAEVFLSDIIWHPGIYYDIYCEKGGFLSKEDWVMLCQTKRRG